MSEIAAGPREQEALDEMARTRVGRRGAVVLFASLVALIAAGPALELRRHLRGQSTVFPGEPALPGPGRLAETVRSEGVWKANESVHSALRALEDRMGRFSAVSAMLRPRAQWHLLDDLRFGNSQVIVGPGGAFEYHTALFHVTSRPFLDPRELERRRAAAANDGLEPDPAPGLIRLAADLERHGVRLLFLPVPVKSQIHPEMMLRPGTEVADRLANPSTAELLERLEAAGVVTYDPEEELRAAARAGEPVYFLTDTHWNPRGMEIAARGLARRLRERGLVDERPPAGLERHSFDFSFPGDLVKLLGIGPFDTRIPPEKTKLHAVRGLGGTDYDTVTAPGDVLLLGDSYSMVFSFGGKGAASFPDQLAFELDRPVRRIAVTAANDLPDRVRWLRRNPALLEGVHTVVYEVTARALSVADWKPTPLERPKSKKRRKP